MFNGWVIFAACVGTLAGVAAGVMGKYSKYTWLESAGFTSCCLCALYCLAAGLYFSVDWQSPFANTDSAKLAQAAGSHGPKVALIVFIIGIWPYFLIGAGGWFAFQSGRIQIKKYMGGL